MKINNILIILLLLLGCENTPAEPQNVHGCLDSQACNYNSNATIDNNSCWYAEEGCECINGEGASVDICGVCDTDETNNCIQDECGIWGGDNSSCTDECGVVNGDGPSENCDCYGNCLTVENLAGTWDTTSQSSEMTMSIDYGLMFSGVDAYSCTYMGGTYTEADGCVLDETTIAIYAGASCTEMGGTLSGNICSASGTEDLCCGATMEMLSQTITIVDHGDHGDMTIVATYNDDGDGEMTETSYALVEVDGTDITITYGSDDDHDDHGDDDHGLEVMSGTITIDGDTATMVFPMDMDMFDDEDHDDDHDDMDDMMGMTMSGAMTLVLEKQY